MVPLMYKHDLSKEEVGYSRLSSPFLEESPFCRRFLGLLNTMELLEAKAVARMHRSTALYFTFTETFVPAQKVCSVSLRECCG